jgi:hypothetical protein
MRDTDETMQAETLRALQDLRDENHALHDEARRVSQTMERMAEDIHVLAENRGGRRR